MAAIKAFDLFILVAFCFVFANLIEHSHLQSTSATCSRKNPADSDKDRSLQLQRQIHKTINDPYLFTHFCRSMSPCNIKHPAKKTIRNVIFNQQSNVADSPNTSR